MALSLALLALASPASAVEAVAKKKPAAAKKAMAGKTVSIPMSTFQSTATLKIGGPVQWTAPDGKHYVGTIKTIGKDQVTARVVPAKVVVREVPFTAFQSVAGAKVGMPVNLTIDGKVVNGTVIAIGTNTLSVEIPVP